MHPRLLLASTLLAACAADVTPETSDTESEVLGGVGYTNCTAEQTAFVETAHRYARITSVSRAFEQCVEQAAINGIEPTRGYWTGPYRQCIGDPYYGHPLADQIRRALDAARSPNKLAISCTGGGGNASAALGRYDDTDDESLAFSGWLAAAMASPRVGAAPFAQTAETIWHEAMHQHGYTHGANEQAPALPACGYAGDPTWHFQVNTMPYLLGSCMSGVLNWSAETCGPIDACGPGMLRLVDAYGSKSCECVADPDSNSWRVANAFTHLTTVANTSSGMTTLDHPLLNGHANAVVQITHTFSPPGTGGAYNTARTQVWYNYSTGRWVIQNAGGGAMPINTGFFVRVGRGTVHRTTASSITGHWSYIDHPLANGNPSALVTVTRAPYAGAWSGTVDDHPIGVYYSATARRWAVFNQDYVAMPVDTAFDVDVETSQNHGLHFIHRVDSTNRSEYLTRLSSPFLDGNPNARMLVTLDWTRGSVYDLHEFSVWYDGARWWIYHDDGTPMTNGLAFHVEVLKDEMQRWVTVPENFTLKDSSVDVAPTDRVRISGAGMLQPFLTTWANDAGGGATAAGAPFPLAAPRYSLIGRFGLGAEPYFPIGRDAWPTPPPSTRRLYLRANDDIVGNGSGAFTAEVRVFR